MREAVIVSTARTGIGRAYKGSLNNVKSPTLAGHVIAQAVHRAGIDAAEVEDVVLGTVLSVGTAAMNLARNAALAAGLTYVLGDIKACTADEGSIFYKYIIALEFFLNWFI
jgi:acetyl-CoA acetyltransferase